MTAFVDFESALIGMVSRNFPVSELVYGGVAVCTVWLRCLRVGTGPSHHWSSFLHRSQIWAVLPKPTPKSPVTADHFGTRALELCLGLLQQLPLTSLWRFVSQDTAVSAAYWLYVHCKYSKDVKPVCSRGESRYKSLAGRV